MYIYKVTNLLNGKLYVGLSKSMTLAKKWNSIAYKDNHAVGKYIREVGTKHFKIEIIQNCFSIEELEEMERFWIQKLKSYEPYGYNKELGGIKNKKKTILSSKRHSDAQKRRFARDGAARLGTKGRLNPRSKPVICIENGVVYESANIAAQSLGIRNRSHITRVLKGKRRSTNGYTFQYAKMNHSE